jgi:hypothetical protein
MDYEFRTRAIGGSGSPLGSVALFDASALVKGIVVIGGTERVIVLAERIVIVGGADQSWVDTCVAFQLRVNGNANQRAGCDEQKTLHCTCPELA